MGQAERKIELAKRLLEVANEEVLNNVQAALDNQFSMTYEELPPAMQAAFDEGMEQSNSGNVIPHQQVMDEINKRWQGK
jgi:predicted transcriptional regulator